MTYASTMKLDATKVPGQLSIVTVGDVHIGHHTTKADWIVNNLYQITNDPQFGLTTDYLFIEGDLFDRLLYLNNIYLGPIQVWIIYLLTYCASNNIALRVLEGTPYHDMRQSQLFIDLNEGYDIGCDVLYVTDLHYEVHAPTGMSILYLPDEHRSECEQSYEMAKRLLTENGVTKADFILMHGAFDYQLPAIVKNKHSSQNWQELVEHYIFVGHVHQFSQYGKILAAGSFDRLCHGDESAKGYIRVTIKPGGDSIQFIENTNAKIYKTINCRGQSVESALQSIKDVVAKYPAGSYVRILAYRTDNIAVALDILKVEYPSYYWKLEKEDEFVTTIDDVAIEVTLQQSYVPIDLTKDNLPDLLAEELRLKSVSENDIARAMVLLRKLL